MLMLLIFPVAALVLLQIAADDGTSTTTTPPPDTDNVEEQREFNGLPFDRPEGEELAGFEDPVAGKYLLSVVQSGREEVFELNQPPYANVVADEQAAGNLVSSYKQVLSVLHSPVQPATAASERKSVFSGKQVEAPRLVSSFFSGMRAWPPLNPLDDVGRSRRHLQQPDALFAAMINSLLNPNPMAVPDPRQDAGLQQMPNLLLGAPANEPANVQTLMYQQDTPIGTDGLEKTSIVPCAIRDKLFLSTKFTTIPNVESLYDCQLICQLYSNPAILTGCITPTENQGSVCVGASFNLQDGRCSIYSSISGTANAKGIDSAPVACASEMFAAPESLYEELQADATVSACLQQASESHHIGYISHIPDSYVPGLLSSSSMSHTESFSGLKTETSRQLLTDVLDLSWPTWKSQLTNYTGADDWSPDSIWYYNPPIPASMKSDLFENGIYQPQELGFHPLEIPLGQATWSIGSGVYDWRECALLCSANAVTCEAWTYVFEDLTYNATMGACHLSTDSNQLITEVPSSMQTVAGLAISNVPSDLFTDLDPKAPKGSDASIAQAAWNNSASSFASSFCRVDRGLLYTNRAGNSTVEVGASSTSGCLQQCATMPGCVGTQYISSELLSGSARLYNVQTLPCLLLLGEGPYPLDATPSDPNIMTAITECTHANSTYRYRVTDVLDAEKDKALLSGAVFYEGHVHGSGIPLEGGGNDLNKDHGCQYQGYSFTGTLRSTVNSFDNSTLIECTSKCLEGPDCAGVALGSWGTCYLYANITQIIADPLMTAASQDSTVCNLPRPPQATGNRELIDCSQVARQVVFTSGIALGNITSPSADDLTPQKCFKACRERQGCNFISYVENRDADSATKAGCLLLSRAADASAMVGATSAVANCDIPFEQMHFDDDDAVLSRFAKLEWRLFGAISGASVAVIGVIGSAIVLLQRRRNNDNAPGGDRNDARSDSTEVEIEYGEDALSLMDPLTAKSRNAFGMNLLENEDTPAFTEDEDQALANVDDFERMEAKSTGHRLRLQVVSQI